MHSAHHELPKQKPVSAVVKDKDDNATHYPTHEQRNGLYLNEASDLQGERKKEEEGREEEREDRKTQTSRGNKLNRFANKKRSKKTAPRHNVHKLKLCKF